MTDEELRLKCLELAMQIPSGTEASIDDVLREAARLVEFVRRGVANNAEVLKLVGQ